jgi:hypothetical protein
MDASEFIPSVVWLGLRSKSEKMIKIKTILTLIILALLLWPLYYSFKIAFFTIIDSNIRIIAMGLFASIVVGGINMIFSFILLDREKIQSNIIKDFRGENMSIKKTILWNFKRKYGENFIEEYSNLLKIIPTDVYANENLTKREYYAMRINEARRSYAYFFFNLYNDRGDIGKRFLKKVFNSDDIKLLFDIVKPMEKKLAEHKNSDFDKKEAFNYFGELFKKVKK